MTSLKYSGVVISDALALTAACVQDGRVQTLEMAVSNTIGNRPAVFDAIKFQL